MAHEAAGTNGGNGVAIPPGRGTVLLVTEDRADLHYYSVIIRAFECPVRMCASYQEGARMAESGAFDLIIVSQGGSNFEGRAVLERAHQFDPGLPVLVLAHYLDLRCLLEAIDLGAADYLDEPISVLKLGRAMRSYLRVQPVLKRPVHRASRHEQSASLSF